MHYHFIAIGGAIMHNLALELQANGHIVTGSDDEIFDPAKSRLAAAGLLPKQYGWDPKNIPENTDAIILGMHAKADNPELVYAEEKGIKIYSFPDFVYEHSKDKTRVVIGGSNGKTTSTAMLMHVLMQAGMDFDYLVGSQIDGFERMVKLSPNAKVMIIEGDEYLTSALDRVPKFHKYHPHFSMITGIAWDHINVFPTWEGYVGEFETFVKHTVKGGHCYLFEGDEELRKMKPRYNFCSYYNTPNYIENEDSTVVEIGGVEYSLSFFGEHNLQNAAGVQKLAADLGIRENDFWKHMQSFAGSARRMEKVLDTEDLVIFRDFAHSPSKCKATVQAVKNKYKDREIVAVFELHTYSSLRKDFIPEYAGCFELPTEAYILFDPHVLELKGMPMLDNEFIEKEVPNTKAFGNSSELKKEVLNRLKNAGPKVLLLMSSGKLGGETFY